jgi:transposase
MIAAVIERCVGIDVGKKVVAACVMVGEAAAEPEWEVREYGTTVEEIRRLREWAVANGCTHAAVESTSVYWQPVFNQLEDALTVVLAQPQQVKARKGHKTDRADAWWLAHLLRHAMIRPSFIPPRAVRELRDLTRLRRRVLAQATQERNRVEKLLEKASVKITSVISDLFGISGQRMLEALLEGKASAEEVASLVHGTMRKKVPALVAALNHHQLNDHHRLLIRLHVDHLAFLETEVHKIDEAISNQIRNNGWLEQQELLTTIPGVGSNSAASILAEVGPDMSTFGSERKISAWAGVCPGNAISAGQSKGSQTPKGNPHLKTTLSMCAIAVSHTLAGSLKDKFDRIAPRGRAKAATAVSHAILTNVFRVLQSNTSYREPNRSLSDRRKARLIRHHIRKLGKLGVGVRTTT